MNRILLIGLAVFGVIGPVAARADGPVPPIAPEDMVLGQANAPVTVIEYASMTCPHCARWEQEVFPKVKSELIDTGKIRYAYRDFPLDGLALKASQLAHCQPDRFYGFIDVLFQSQSAWIPKPGEDPLPELAKIGKLGGISDSKFKECMDDKRLETAVVASRQGGEAAGVNSTPTFFFNGKSHAGELTYEDFLKQVQDAGS